jgi:hypothetical protein
MLHDVDAVWQPYPASNVALGRLPQSEFETAGTSCSDWQADGAAAS